jgi:hypothetical protein
MRPIGTAETALPRVDMTQQPHQLDYGTHPRRRRWWVGALVATIIATAVSLTLLKDFIVDIRDDWRKGRQAVADYQTAKRAVPPAGALVYGEYEDRAQAYAHPQNGPSLSSGSWGWRSYEFSTVVTRQATSNSLDIVLHISEHVSSAGQRRLVQIALDARMQPIGRQENLPYPMTVLSLSVDQFDWRGNPKSQAVTGAVQLGFWPDPRERRTRFYFGAADPADASRFSIRYEVGSDEDGFAEGFIDGKLEDDLTVTLTLRDGPLRE